MTAIAADSPIGYIMEFYLQYPVHLHDLHNAYLLAPEHLSFVSHTHTHALASIANLQKSENLILS